MGQDSGPRVQELVDFVSETAPGVGGRSHLGCSEIGGSLGCRTVWSSGTAPSMLTLRLSTQIASGFPVSRSSSPDSIRCSWGSQDAWTRCGLAGPPCVLRILRIQGLCCRCSPQTSRASSGRRALPRWAAGCKRWQPPCGPSTALGRLCGRLVRPPGLSSPRTDMQAGRCRAA